MNRIEQKDIDRFFSKVDRTSSPNGCWEWTAGKFNTGYGCFTYKGKHYRSHRFSWMIKYGEIPYDLHVLHHCDNPPCVNPDHLFLGNHQENMKDMRDKNRDAEQKGEFNGNSKLTEEEIISIRKEYAEGNVYQKDLAMKYNTDQSNINLIVNRKNWKHL